MPPKIDYGFKALRETERFIYVDIPQKMDAEHREDICKGVGLELAEISSVQDYKTVSKALDGTLFIYLSLDSFIITSTILLTSISKYCTM